MDVLGAPTAYAALAALDPDLPLETAQGLLVRRLARTGGRAELWQPRPGSRRMRVVAAWPASGGNPADLSAREVGDLPGVDRVRLPDGSVLTRSSGTDPQDLTGTANCLTVLHRREELRARRRCQADYTAQLAGEVLDSSRRLTRIRDLERQRLGAQIASFSAGRLTRLQRSVDRMLAQRDGWAGEPARMRADLERTTAEFRTMVRGIHSQTLYRRGLHAALVEAATGAQPPVRVDGHIAARIEPMLLASLYHLIASCLRTCAGSMSDLHITLGLEATGIQATVRVRTPLPEAVFRAALAVESDRIGMVGGRVRVLDEDERLTMIAWVPGRLEPVADARLVDPGTLYARVRSLVLRLVARSSDEARARDLLGRLDRPVQLAVVGPPEHPAVRQARETVRSRQDLMLIARRPGRPRRDLTPDVVLRLDEPSGTFVLELPEVGPLTRVRVPDLPGVLTTEVVSRADLLRARTALAAMRTMVLSAPPSVPGPTLGELEALWLRTGKDLTALRVSTG